MSLVGARVLRKEDPNLLTGFDRPVLAGDRVRFVGEPVAVIVADDRYAAADAVEGVVVDYEPLPPLVTTDQALADDATPLFDLRVPRHTGVGFQKFRRRAQDWAIVGAVATRTNGATVVGLMHMGGTPVRAEAVETALADGASPDAAAGSAADGTSPPSDLHASADYRRHLARVLTRRALQQLAG